MIRLLSVILYLDHADAIVQYLHNMLVSALEGALLIIADLPYDKTTDEEGFKELIDDDWETVNTSHFSRYPIKGSWIKNVTAEVWPKSYRVTTLFESSLRL